MRNSHAVLHSDYQFAFPPAEYKPSLLFTFLLPFLITYLFDDSHTNSCEEGDLIVVLVCIFLLIGWTSFHAPVACWMSYLGKKKILFQSFVYFEIGLFGFFFYWNADTILFRKPWRFHTHTHKINIQKLVAFLYTNNEQSEKDWSVCIWKQCSLQ